MKKKKSGILGAAALVLVAILFCGAYLASRPDTDQGSKTIAVEVVHKDGTRVEFTYTTEAEYLGEVLQTEELIQCEEGTYGMFITEVDGERAIYEVDGHYWAIYEEDDYATTGVEQIPVRDGGRYGLVCTKG